MQHSGGSVDGAPSQSFAAHARPKDLLTERMLIVMFRKQVVVSVRRRGRFRLGTNEYRGGKTGSGGKG